MALAASCVAIFRIASNYNLDEIATVRKPQGPLRASFLAGNVLLVALASFVLVVFVSFSNQRRPSGWH